MSSASTIPAEFRREKLKVNGVDVIMLTAGSGEPLLFFHGAGTWHGFDFALPWASRFQVMIPYHPGWGESADAPEMTTPDDYALHYLELIDQLKQRVTIVIVTHNMQQAGRVADRTAFMLDGRLVEVGPTKDIFTKPTDPRTEEYVTGKFG